MNPGKVPLVARQVLAGNLRPGSLVCLVTSLMPQVLLLVLLPRFIAVAPVVLLCRRKFSEIAVLAGVCTRLVLLLTSTALHARQLLPVLLPALPMFLLARLDILRVWIGTMSRLGLDRRPSFYPLAQLSVNTPRQRGPAR